MAESKKDAITLISRGKSTKAKIGSRSMPHRLRNEESLAVRRAIDLGCLELYPWSRENPSNIFKKLCISLNKRPIFCVHEKKQSVVWYELAGETEATPRGQFPFMLSNNVMSIFLEERKSAKLLAKSLSQSLS